MSTACLRERRDSVKQAHSEKTVQVIGKIHVTVISNFNLSRHSAEENIKRLLQNEAEVLSKNQLDKAGTARYTVNEDAGLSA